MINIAEIREKLNCKTIEALTNTKKKRNSTKKLTEKSDKPVFSINQAWTKSNSLARTVNDLESVLDSYKERHSNRVINFKDKL